MPGYLGGGGSSSGGAGGEIRFPKEFIDPVTKLRVSNPQNLIDTDFEYGLQPTKWETVELINNTPSFFSKSGDTTIDGIRSITTNAGTREITVRTELEHGLAVGIPINVQGTKSITAEGSYIINSIPDEFTFTYLAKDTQPETASINDLYSSIITGEFFQGSQLRISSIVTDAVSPISELTVTTQSTHGFGPNTPFYFLNLNSTIAQEFPASNTETRSFDSSNSATAQTFDGSNTLSSINIDFSNSATEGGFPSNVTSGVDPNADTIEVSHPAEENFADLKIGQALYYNVSAGSGFFQANPRGVVFLLTTDGLGTSSSTFQVSEIPNGTPINITGAMTGTFQIANQARTFAGNNINPDTEVTLGIVEDSPKVFDGANENGNVVINPQFDGTNAFTVTSQSGVADITWAFNTMVRFDTTGDAPSGLIDGETYFVNQIFQQGSTNDYFMRVSELPNQTPINIGTNGTGDMTFTEIGISLTKDIIHVPNHGYQPFDMLKYTYPDGGRFDADEVQNFYYVQTVFDSNNFNITHTLGEVTPEFQSFGPFDYGEQSVTSEINIVGFTAPYTFSVTSGVLPQGLTLNESTGVVSGTPEEVYDNQVVITMTDANGSQDNQTIAFEFTQPPFLYDFSSATFNTGGQRGRIGPTEAQARGSVSGSPNPSTWANTYLNVSSSSRGIQEWTVPQSGDYRITVAGAGTDVPAGGGDGQGAVMQATFFLNQGEVLYMAVGQINGGSGNRQWAGGGGGTTVARGSSLSASEPLIVAGGGGASRSRSSTNLSIQRANTGTRGKDGSGGRRGGINGGAANGSAVGVSGSGHNANGFGSATGFYEDGRVTGDTRYGGGVAPISFRNGHVGGLFNGSDGTYNGGFGGGGNGGWGGSGGGGGYSGGGDDPNGGYAGGGGSFISIEGSNANTSDGSFSTSGGTRTPAYSGGVGNLNQWNSGAGYITITKL